MFVIRWTINQPTCYDKLIQIRAPEFLTRALDSAADKRLTSREHTAASVPTTIDLRCERPL